ncbi:AAA family ATPase [Deltaproteobacteria bacterium TL4]
MNSSQAILLIKTLQENLVALFGRPSPVIRYALASILAGGHILLEDIPGMGKTTFAQMISHVLQLDFQRIQFTSDLMPSDIVGVEIYLQQLGSFEFKKGPLFHNLVLADELNRASPKTQSALLQAMTEDAIDIGNHQHPLPQPFVIIATQNPVTFAGTYPLPESQLDRFMVKLSIGYPPEILEKQLIQKSQLNIFENQRPELKPKNPVNLLELRSAVEEVAVRNELIDYLYQIVNRTRNHSEIKMGVSLRGALLWMRLCKGLALCHKRDYVIPDDLCDSFIPASLHRMVFNRPEQGEKIATELLEEFPFPA